ncbi:MAG: GNAT family N-acetyltransferase [Candidatus Microsaccharimonas sp.]
MRFKVGNLQVELAPLTKESMSEFVNLEYGGGMQQLGVRRFTGSTNAPVLEDELDWFEKARQTKDAITWGVWVIEEERRLIGNSAIFDIGKEGTELIRQGTTGSMLFRKDYWGKGIASAAHKARTWYAFQHMGLHRLKSAVIQENVGSSKALSRSGYNLVYTERNESFVDGSLRNMDCFECLNPADFFWTQWWHGDRPTKRALVARQVTREAMDWARQNVELP